MEALLRRFPAAEMGVFVKTGSEATTAAVRIARRATGRRTIARCGYHGWHDWCVPEEDLVPEGLSDQVSVYDAMRPETLSELLNAQPGRFAAVILAPEMIYPPSPENLKVLMAAARRHGAVFIMAEVKTGSRAPGGSMQAFYGVTPDVMTLSKALGNGWPVGAVVGKRAVMTHAAGMHLSATYHGDTVAVAAALATMDIMERDGVQATVWTLGQRLIEGLNEAARRNHFPAEAYGEPIPPMPFLRFTHLDPARNEQLRDLVYARVMAGGVLLHPRHMWFVSASHSVADIERVVEMVDAAMRAVAVRSPELLAA